MWVGNNEGSGFKAKFLKIIIMTLENMTQGNSSGTPKTTDTLWGSSLKPTLAKKRRPVRKFMV